MRRYLVIRALAVGPALVFLSVVTFLLLTLAPGDPAEQVARQGRPGAYVPPTEVVGAVRARMGLDRPLPAQYLRWLGDAIQGDLGRSYRSGQPVVHHLRETIPATALLGAVGLSIGWGVGVALGIATGLSRGGPRRAVANGFVLGSLSIPPFAIALLAIWLASWELGIAPTGGISPPGEPRTPLVVLQHLWLPAAVMAMAYFGWFAKPVEAAISEAKRRPHVTAARAKGLSPSVVARRHIVRNALIPFVAQAGASAGVVVAGAYVIEAVFTWPGVGQLLIVSANERDYPVVVGITLVTGIVVILANLLADVVIAYLDPRIAGSNSG